MTIHQFNTIKWINSEGFISIEQLKKCHQGNIGSLAKNKWIKIHGKKIFITESGLSAIEYYRHRLVRKRSADLTERVKRFLHVSKILMMVKAA